jgi:hypothetical protein
VYPSSAAPPSWRPGRIKKPYPQAGPADIPLNDRGLSRPLDISRRPQQPLIPSVPQIDNMPSTKTETSDQNLLPGAPNILDDSSGWGTNVGLTDEVSV